MKNKSAIHFTVQTALLCTFLCVSSLITIPAPVPFTLQTFGVFFALLSAGGKSGTLAILLYITLGALGLPVFSSFGAGVGVLAGPTGGYIVGFLIMGVFFMLFEKLNGSDVYKILLSVSGLVLCYLTGTLWFVHCMKIKNGTMTFWSAILTCVLPYIIPDLLKLGLAYITSKKIQNALSQGKGKKTGEKSF